MRNWPKTPTSVSFSCIRLSLLCLATVLELTFLQYSEMKYVEINCCILQACGMSLLRVTYVDIRESLVFDGIARYARIMTCVQNVTWPISTISNMSLYDMIRQRRLGELKVRFAYISLPVIRRVAYVYSVQITTVLRFSIVRRLAVK
jgi:hypothetical protein